MRGGGGGCQSLRTTSDFFKYLYVLQYCTVSFEFQIVSQSYPIKLQYVTLCFVSTCVT